MTNTSSKDHEDASAITRWNTLQDMALRKAVRKYGQKDWKRIALDVSGRNDMQCLQRWTSVLKSGLVKGHWSNEEDRELTRIVNQGPKSWGQIAKSMVGRTAKQCRERWKNHLDPAISRLPFTPDEDFALRRAYEEYGNRWSHIASLLPGRTESSVKARCLALIPKANTKFRPGRPRLLPDMVGTGARPFKRIRIADDIHLFDHSASHESDPCVKHHLDNSYPEMASFCINRTEILEGSSLLSLSRSLEQVSPKETYPLLSIDPLPLETCPLLSVDTLLTAEEVDLLPTLFL